MKNKELYDKTVNILVQAYFNDTLKHGDCAACAVGNIIAGAGVPRCRHTTEENNGFNNASWGRLFKTYVDCKDQTVFSLANDECKEQIFKAIEMTGYNWKELAKVEFAFEKAKGRYHSEEKMFNGLMAVIEVLDEIHDNKDTSITTQSKKRFNKTPAL